MGERNCRSAHHRRSQLVVPSPVKQSDRDRTSISRHFSRPAAISAFTCCWCARHAASNPQQIFGWCRPSENKVFPSLGIAVRLKNLCSGRGTTQIFLPCRDENSSRGPRPASFFFRPLTDHSTSRFPPPAGPTDFLGKPTKSLA